MIFLFILSHFLKYSSASILDDLPPSDCFVCLPYQWFTSYSKKLCRKKNQPNPHQSMKSFKLTVGTKTTLSSIHQIKMKGDVWNTGNIPWSVLASYNEGVKSHLNYFELWVITINEVEDELVCKCVRCIIIPSLVFLFEIVSQNLKVISSPDVPHCIHSFSPKTSKCAHLVFFLNSKS